MEIPFRSHFVTIPSSHFSSPPSLLYLSSSCISSHFHFHYCYNWKTFFFLIPFSIFLHIPSSSTSSVSEASKSNTIQHSVALSSLNFYVIFSLLNNFAPWCRLNCFYELTFSNFSSQCSLKMPAIHIVPFSLFSRVSSVGRSCFWNGWMSFWFVEDLRWFFFACEFIQSLFYEIKYFKLWCCGKVEFVGCETMCRRLCQWEKNVSMSKW